MRTAARAMCIVLWVFCFAFLLALVGVCLPIWPKTYETKEHTWSYTTPRRIINARHYTTTVRVWFWESDTYKELTTPVAPAEQRPL